MKNIKQGFEDTLRPEYRRSDFAGSVRGKYADAEFEFADIARAFIVCIGEDEGLSFARDSQGNYPTGHKSGDWTYEIDNADQITLRYWLDESESIEESLANLPGVSNPYERTDLQNLLTEHVRALKARVAALYRG